MILASSNQSVVPSTDKKVATAGTVPIIMPFIHHFTRSGLLLDEVKSLLQKALRRKERYYALSACKELDQQLKFHHVLVYLFEDHYHDARVLKKFVQLYNEKDIKTCVELLLELKTYRTVAALPVVTLQTKYNPSTVICNDAAKEFCNLVVEEEGKLNVGRLLTTTMQAWNECNTVTLLTCFKLLTMIVDYENRLLTEKGKAQLLTHRRGNRNMVELILSLLHGVEPVLHNYIYQCYVLSKVQSAPFRLILFSVLFHKITAIEEVSFRADIGELDWSNVADLKHMPNWAIDCHTYRGRTGESTLDIAYKYHPDMDEDFAEEFHGVRPVKDRKDFLLCVVENKDNDPYWDEALNVYEQYGFRTTNTMTNIYYSYLKKTYYDMFNKSRHPLLQKPTNRRKVYTRLDFDNKYVVKGPYKTNVRYNNILFNHYCLREILHDEHTLEVHGSWPYLKFPLIVGEDCNEYSVECADFYDPIANHQLIEEAIVARESLGYIQAHNLTPAQLCRLPFTIFVHFIYRALLNVGDSGLYNVLTNAHMTETPFVYGIDIEEIRHRYKDETILDLMFTLKPKKALCLEIMSILTSSKDQIMNILNQSYDYERMCDAAKMYRVPFNESKFRARLHTATALLNNL